LFTNFQNDHVMTFWPIKCLGFVFVDKFCIGNVGMDAFNAFCYVRVEKN
jgi:hypothetical protein